MKRPSWRLGLLVALPPALVACVWLARRPSAPVMWRTTRVERGDVAPHIKATGTLNALTQVSVGTQVSGVVTALYADFNSEVRKGQVIAEIDATVMRTQLVEAQAGLRRAQAAFDQAQADLGRQRALAQAQLISASALDTALAAFKTAEGNLEAARAGVTRAQVNLSYCTITAPVEGVVVSRVVDVGQTVAASFSTPSLFAIAQDLSRMKLQASIDEADIGQVSVGQSVTFTVDSYPDRTFEGVVSQVQLNPTVTSNVVTYAVVMDVANAPRTVAPVKDPRLEARTARYLPAHGTVYRGQYALFPGMTAHVTLQTARRTHVLKVANQALRFSPDGQAPSEASPRLWIREGAGLRAIPVRIGLTDSTCTEVSGPDLREGLEVVVGQAVTPAVPTQAAPALGAGAGPGGPPPR